MARALDLPLIHLDRFYWKPGWIEPPAEEWNQMVMSLVARDAWIMDGNYSRTLSLRLPRAEAVVLLDPPTPQCLWGVIRRGLVTRGKRRPDMAEGCEEKPPDFQFLRYVMSYKRRSRPKVLRLIGDAEHVQFHHLRNRRDATEFVSRLEG